MLKLNSFIINGKSTADFSFYVAVEENDPPRKAKKKDKLWEPEHTTGVLRQSVNAYESKVKSYKFYLYNVTKEQYREFKTWLAPNGWFTEWFENDLKYYYESVDFDSEVCDEVNGYEIKATFICQPFGMLAETTGTLGASITNSTNAPMYPKLVFTINSSVNTTLTIGNQTMIFKPMIDTVTIECKPGYQDVVGTGGKKLNDMVSGDFFAIQPGTSNITKSAGIGAITITNRWGWN